MVNLSLFVVAYLQVVKICGQVGYSGDKTTNPSLE